MTVCKEYRGPGMGVSECTGIEKLGVNRHSYRFTADHDLGCPRGSHLLLSSCDKATACPGVLGSAGGCLLLRRRGGRLSWWGRLDATSESQSSGGFRC